MRFARLMIVTTLFTMTTALADETPLNSPIESISLFKNGLAVVRRSAEVAGSGVYRLDDVPEPVHGTFWIEGDIPVDAQVTMRQVDKPARRGVDFQQDLVNHEVTISFKQGNIPAVNGIVVALQPPTGSEAWSRSYQAPQYRYYSEPDAARAAGNAGFLVLDTGHGRAFVDPSEIAYVIAKDGGATTPQRVPVLLLTTHGLVKKGTIHISYLTRGIGWAPGYRVNLVDDQSLTIEQQAVVKNELADINDAELSLISGYPSIQFGHVVSPLALSQNWAEFFNQINRNPAEDSAAGMNNAMAQQAVSNRNDASGLDLSAPPAGEGVDLHYESIGKRTMSEGDSLMVSVASGSAKYQRIVEWVVADRRDAEGRMTNREEYNRPGNEIEHDQPWDAVKFKNPLSFPMTTGPAMIQDQGRFAGQRLSFWVNAGEETTLHITKSLSIRTRAIEQENADAPRQLVNVGGHSYRKVDVNGDLTVSNHRNQEVNLVIHRQFSGDLIKADAKPAVTLREEGVYSINRRYDLTWKLPLKPGEEQTLHYAYAVLVAD